MAQNSSSFGVFGTPALTSTPAFNSSVSSRFSVGEAIFGYKSSSNVPPASDTLKPSRLNSTSKPASGTAKMTPSSLIPVTQSTETPRVSQILVAAPSDDRLGFGASIMTSAQDGSATPKFGYLGNGIPAEVLANKSQSVGFVSNTVTLPTGFGYEYYGNSAPTTTTTGITGTHQQIVGGAGHGFEDPSSTTQAAIPTSTAGGGIGLGGTPNNSGVNPNPSFSTKDGSNPKINTEFRADDQPLHAELLTMIDEFKNHMKNVTINLTEISENPRKAELLSNYCNEIEQSVSNVHNLYKRYKLNLDTIQKLISQDIKDAETAQLIKDTPNHLKKNYQFSMQYLFRAVKNFADRMNVYERQIEMVEIAFTGDFVALNPNELFNGLQASKNVLIVLAARVKTLHEQVLEQVESTENMFQIFSDDWVMEKWNGKESTKPQPKPFLPPRQDFHYLQTQYELAKPSQVTLSLQNSEPSEMYYPKYINYLVNSNGSSSPSAPGLGRLCRNQSLSTMLGSPSMNVQCQSTQLYDTLPFSVTGTPTPTICLHRPSCKGDAEKSARTERSSTD